MKKSFLFLSLIISITDLYLYADENKAQEQESVASLPTKQEANNVSDNDDEKSQVIVAHFANVVQNFFNIVKEPKNPANVTTQIAYMLGNIINMVVEATKKCGDINEEEIYALLDTAQMRTTLTHLVLEKIKKYE